MCRDHINSTLKLVYFPKIHPTLSFIIINENSAFRQRMEYSYFPPDFRLKYSNGFVDYKEKFFLFNNVCMPGMKHTAWCCANVCHVTLESLSKDEGNGNNNASKQ